MAKISTLKALATPGGTLLAFRFEKMGPQATEEHFHHERAPRE